MTMEQIVDEIKLELTGGVLELEIPDTTLVQVVDKALREIQRYIDLVKFETIPYTGSCIDLSPRKIHYIHSIFRTSTLGSAVNNTASGISTLDPMQASYWQMVSGGNLYNFQDYSYNYSAYVQLQQIQNTVAGSDLDFMYDKNTNKLYINVVDQPSKITIAYTPLYNNVEDVTSPFWEDCLTKLSIALTKIILGRIRTRFTQSSSLWTQDGETLLAEGNQELATIREKLKQENNLFTPID